MALCEETIYQIALTRIKGMNLLLAKTLLDTIGSASGIFKEKGQNLQNICKLQTPVFSDESIKTAIETAKREIDFIEKNHIIPLFFLSSFFCCFAKRFSCFFFSKSLSNNKLLTSLWFSRSM